MIASQTEFPLRVAVCAWCRPKERGDGVGAISHGICPRHLRKLKTALQEERRREQKDQVILRMRCSHALKESIQEIARLQEIGSSDVCRAACEEYILKVHETRPTLPLF